MSAATATDAMKPDTTTGVLHTGDVTYPTKIERGFTPVHTFDDAWMRTQPKSEPLEIPVWSGPCEDMFSWLATNAPGILVGYLQEKKLRPTDLTFAAEVAGRHLPAHLVVGPLIELLQHASPIVREGVIYGLSYHACHPAADEALRGARDTDADISVQEAADEVLAGL